MSLPTDLINDPRDRPFLWLTAACTVVVPPFAAALYVPGLFRWWLAAAYLGLIAFVFLDRFILMLHNTSHRPLFKRRWMNHYIPWVLGPFFGETPDTYYAHHVGMHHAEGNLREDLSSTMEYQRDSALDFLRYYFRFITRGYLEVVAYFTRKNRPRLRRMFQRGEWAFFAMAAVLMFVNWRATLVVFVFPVFAVRFLMMAGNWGQHAFVDPATPESSYRNSITVLDERYNRRCFNDGYHIGHHLVPVQHWTEMPEDFERNREAYLREGAIVFEGIDYFGVWARLMVKAYRSLARHYVSLASTRPSEAAIVSLLRERVQRFPPQDAHEALPAEA